jgi:hypothetical protein
MPGLAVVVAEADGGRTAGRRGWRRAASPAARRSPRRRAGPPTGRGVRLGHEPADRDGAPDVLAAADLAAGLDDLLGELGDLQHVLVGLGRQPAHEVELDLPPAGPVRRRDGVDEVLLGDHLVDDLAQPLAAALGREVSPERRPLRVSSLARSMLKASTRVDGSDRPVCVPSYRSARPLVISAISEWSALTTATAARPPRSPSPPAPARPSRRCR